MISTTLKFELNWCEGTRDWRLVDYKTKAHVQEFYDCPFMRKLSRVHGWKREKPNYIEIDLKTVTVFSGG